MNRALALVVTLSALGLAGCNPIPEAHAAPLGPALTVSEAMAAQTYGSVDSFEQSVGTTAERLGGPKRGERPDADAGPNSAVSYQQIRCYVLSDTPVCFGNEDVNTTNRCYALCAATASCRDAVLTWPTNDLYAVSTSGSVDVTCTVVK